MAPVINREEVSLSQEEIEQIFGWLTQNQRKLLLVPEVRQHLSQIQMAEALRNQTVEKIEGGREGTVKHNFAALEKGLSLERGSQLFAAIMSDSFILKNKEYAKILIIGPREESELFALIGQGFDTRNIFGLDLMSYSPFVTLGDMHGMPFEDDSFDIVVSSFCLNYSDDATRVCREITRVLRDSGIVLIGTEAQSIHDNTTYWATPHKHHWTEPAHLEALFGESFGESIFRCGPTPVLSDGFNRRIVTAFRTRKGKTYNRVIDSFFDEIPAISKVKSHVAAVARNTGMSDEGLAILNGQLDAQLDFVISRRPNERAAHYVSITRSVVGATLDLLLCDALNETFQPTASKFVTRFDLTPPSVFNGGDALATAQEVKEDGYSVLAQALPPDVLRDLGPALSWPDPAWRRLALDPWLLQVVEAHLGCAPVVIGPAAAASDRFEFLPEHLRSLRLFLFLNDAVEMAYVQRSHLDRETDYFARQGWTPDEVAATYGEDRLIPITGKAGTLVLADGGGLLRGCTDTGSVIEIRFANSAFGAMPAPFSLDVVETPYEEQLVKYFPRLFQGAFL